MENYNFKLVDEKFRRKEVLKFLRPITKSRYLPEEVSPRDAKLDLAKFLEHRANLILAEPKIDNRAPRFRISLRYDWDNLNNNAVKIRRIDKDNVELLKALNLISRTGGKVDCWNNAKPKPINLMKIEERKFLTSMVLKENVKMLDLIQSAKSRYPTKEMLKDWKRTKEKIASQAKYSSWVKNLKTAKLTPLVDGISPAKTLRTKCFFDIAVLEEKQNLGRLIFELYADYVPKTCANFQALCQGTDGLSYNSMSGGWFKGRAGMLECISQISDITYRGTSLFVIAPGYWCQGGDVTKLNGSGGRSIYGDTFADENFELNHECVGAMSMWSNGQNSNNSKFNLTFRPLETMDGKRVVFARVISGFQRLRDIEYFGTMSGKPRKTIIVANCGILKYK